MPIRHSFHSLPALIIAAALAASVTGCASIGSPSAPASTATVGAYRDNIDLSGRLSANYQKDGQPQSITGNFTWTQRASNIDVSLASPLGQTLAEIRVTPESATLTQSGRPPRVEKDIDTLTAQALGWSLPVSGLRDWLQGYATDAGGQRIAASPANNNVVTKDGWRLRFVDWQEGSQEGGTAAMPRVINAERSASAAGDALSIRIVINPAG